MMTSQDLESMDLEALEAMCRGIAAAAQEKVFCTSNVEF